MSVEKIGRYEIQGVLGQGAMGVVYKAHDPRLQRYAAIKVMSAVGPVDDEHRARFFHEARSAAKLNHRNIIAIYDLGEDENRPFIAMEYVEGDDLKNVLEDHAFIPFEEKLRFVIEVCQGLEYAHENGVVHRDIKPGNVFITRDGRLKILDFGLARLASSEMTQAGVIMGSPYYMSPEQARGQPDIDGRSDLFSAGVVLYELVSHHRPFEGDNPTAVCFQIVTEPHRAVSQLVPGCPPELEQIVDRALSKNRDERFQSGSEFSEALTSFSKHISEHIPTLKTKNQVLLLDLEEHRQKSDDAIIQDLLHEGLFEPQASETEQSSNDLGVLLLRHAELQRCSDILVQREKTEALLSLNALMAVARSASEQLDLDRCLRALAAVREIAPDQEEALELNRRSLLKKKMTKTVSKQGGKSNPELDQERESQVAVLLDFVRTEASAGNFDSALSTLSRYLEVEPDNSAAVELKEQTETARSGQQEAQEARQAAEPDAPQAEEREATTPMETTRVLPDSSAATDIDSGEVTASSGSLMGQRGLKWAAASLALVAVLAAGLLWLPGMLSQMTTGSLVLNVAPWAQVDSIMRVDSGELVPILDGLSTPCAVSLEPGTYKVQLSNPNLNDSLELDVTIDAGNQAIIRTELPSFDLDTEISSTVKTLPGS